MMHFQYECDGCVKQRNCCVRTYEWKAGNCRHPDKRCEEEKQEATAMFQRISAAYQKLSKDEESDEEDGDDDDDFDYEADVLYEFFAYMLVCLLDYTIC